RQLPDGGELLIEARFALELLQVRQVLEEDEHAGFRLGVQQAAQRVPDHPPDPLPFDLDLAAVILAVAPPARIRGPIFGKGESQLREAPAGRADRIQSEDLSS